MFLKVTIISCVLIKTELEKEFTNIILTLLFTSKDFSQQKTENTIFSYTQTYMLTYYKVNVINWISYD